MCVQASLEAGYPGYLRKVDLQALAQPLSDQPFAVRGAHSDFYTAWSGVRSAQLAFGLSCSVPYEDKISLRF